MSEFYSGPAAGCKRVKTYPAAEHPKLVAIVGGSGAGKSWLSGQLHSRLQKEASQISLDDFYFDRSYLSPARRARLNFDHPRSIDWDYFEETLAQCRAGLPVRIPRYDFRDHGRRESATEWVPGAVVLIEGLWLLRRPSLCRFFDLSIYVDCPARLRAQRRLERDVADRGRSEVSVREQWAQTVAPMHERFVRSQAGKADVIVTSPLSTAALDQLSERIRGLLIADGPWRVPGRRI